MNYYNHVFCSSGFLPFATKERVDWAIGDQIVVAPTGKDGNETEEHVIADVSADKLTLTLTQPLKYTHHGVTEMFEDGQFIEMRWII